MDKEFFQQAYDDLLKKTTLELVSIQHINDDNYIFVAAEQQSRVLISLNNPNVADHDLSDNSLMSSESLNANSLIVFQKIGKQQAKKLFSNLNYNYVYKVIEQCYNIGENLGFYEKIARNENFNLADGFNFDRKETKIKQKVNVVLTNIGEIFFHPMLVEQNTDNLRWIIKKSICIYVRFKIINNELHPILLLTLPYAPRKNITFHLDLHPSFTEPSHLQCQVITHTFKETLSSYLDTLLKRHLKMKVREIKKLTIEDKKNYLMIAHMSKI
jgi:hypothetical protein